MTATTDTPTTADFDLSGKRIFVAGHRGMVGSALARRLAREDCEVLTVGRESLDLTRQSDVERWMTAHRPDAVMIAAARVGGIMANATQPTEFLYENLMIGANLVSASAAAGVGRLLFLGSSCIYPRHAQQPIDEGQLLTGPLEPTNEAYAIAKIACLSLVKSFSSQHGLDYVTAMPTNLYGKNDNFDLSSSHVLPAMLRKMHDAKSAGRSVVGIWGTGAPRREFLHVDDLADACVFLMRRYHDAAPINVGSGEELTIRELAALAAATVGYRGAFEFDTSKPDGAPRKLLNSDRIRALGWRPSISLPEGLRETYRQWLDTLSSARPDPAAMSA
ncbi:GDP-L-fucose synthase family protein [Chenggangzhangella methanolivorans]|uniref:GDP-L-fucose synthase family protein n=1 Tax=Chenggangzhangella methanolivorans TaxID=1437009 RepID=UPI00360C244B